jgi:hypothetical protein
MPLRYKFCAYAIVRLLKRSRLISVAADYTCGLGLSSDHGAYFFDRGGISERSTPHSIPKNGNSVRKHDRRAAENEKPRLAVA